MRMLPGFILLFAVAVSSFAADADQPRVELYRAGLMELTPESQANVIAWSERFLNSANFNSANQPDVLEQSVAAMHERYRRMVRGNHIVVSYDHPKKFKTVAGEVTVVQIVVGLNRPDAVASGLFTVDPEGRVLAHEKYAGILPAELSPQSASPDAR